MTKDDEIKIPFSALLYFLESFRMRKNLSNHNNTSVNQLILHLLFMINLSLRKKPPASNQKSFLHTDSSPL